MGVKEEEVRKGIKKDMEPVLAKKMQRLQAKKDYYHKNAAALDDAAFKILDTSANGKVQREELIAALTFDTDVNQKFHTALGLLTEREAEQIETREIANAAMEKDCAGATVTQVDTK